MKLYQYISKKFLAQLNVFVYLCHVQRIRPADRHSQIGRLAILSFVGIWTILSCGGSEQERPRQWYIHLLQVCYIQLAWVLLHYTQQGSPEPQRDKEAKFPPFDLLLEKYSLPVSIKEFKFANGNVLLKGEKASFYWNVENASSICLNGESLPQGTQTKDIRINKIGKEYFCLEAINGINKAKSKIELNIVDIPKIELKSNKLKLRKGKENKVEISWKISNAKSAQLRFLNKEKNVKLKGSTILNIEETLDIVVEVLALDNKTTISKSILVEVLDESEIEFTSDKEYSYHEVPIKLVTIQRLYNILNNVVKPPRATVIPYRDTAILVEKNLVAHIPATV